MTINLLNLSSGSYIHTAAYFNNHIFYLFVYRLSDATGKMVFSLMGEGSFSKSLLDPNDGKIFLTVLQKYINFPYTAVFIVDSGKEVFVWIGNGTTAAEKHNAMPYAHVRFNLSIYIIIMCCYRTI